MIAFEFDYLCQFLRDRSGLQLAKDKQYLAESRLLPVMRRAGLNSLSDLICQLRTSPSEHLEKSIVEAMATNETLFFRDKVPFKLFKQVMLPELAKARSNSRRIRIWCAAASTGQEPYSLAITLREEIEKWRGWNIEIIGTDISGDVIDKARNGIYSQFEVQRGLPINLLLKYFTQHDDLWQINADIRAMVTWREINLLDNFSHLNQFDIIFCRNLLIYFGNDTKATVLKKLASQIASDGYVLLGASETIFDIVNCLVPHPLHRSLFIPQIETKPSSEAIQPSPA